MYFLCLAHFPFLIPHPFHLQVSSQLPIPTQTPDRGRIFASIKTVEDVFKFFRRHSFTKILHTDFEL